MSSKRSVENGGVSPPAPKRKMLSSTTNKSVAAFFTPTSQRPQGKLEWTTINSSLLTASYLPPNVKAPRRETRRRIAAFDLDSTLVKTASGKKFAKESEDWMWWNRCVPERLRSLDKEGFQIVIFSNQGGLVVDGKPEMASKVPKMQLKRVLDWKQKVLAILNDLRLPVSIHAATERDKYRKPRTGMWQQMLDFYDLDVGDGVDRVGSFFVGDAGGRIGDNDFACSDRDFAANIGIPFYTPEEYFLQQAPKEFRRKFDPAIYCSVAVTTAAVVPRSAAVRLSEVKFTRNNACDIVMFCGSPGAGKSTFYWKYLEPLGYHRVNQDTLKTRQRCLEVAQQFLQQETAITIDNTNADAKTRAYWVELARSMKLPIRCVWFMADARLCEHNDAARAFGGDLLNPEGRAHLPKVAFTSFASRFKAPTMEEGFQDITKVDFVFEGSEEQQAIWSRFWI